MGELEVFIATELVAETVDFVVVEAAIIFLAVGEVAVVMAEVVIVFTVGPVETVVMTVKGAVSIAVVVVTDTIGTEVTLGVVEDRVTVDWEVDNWPEEIIELAISTSNITNNVMIKY